MVYFSQFSIHLAIYTAFLGVNSIHKTLKPPFEKPVIFSAVLSIDLTTWNPISIFSLSSLINIYRIIPLFYVVCGGLNLLSVSINSYSQCEHSNYRFKYSHIDLLSTPAADSYISVSCYLSVNFNGFSSFSNYLSIHGSQKLIIPVFSRLQVFPYESTDQTSIRFLLSSRSPFLCLFEPV